MPGIVAENKYNVVPDRVPTAAARMEMPGPVYPDVVSDNKYRQFFSQKQLFSNVIIHSNRMLNNGLSTYRNFRLNTTG